MGDEIEDEGIGLLGTGEVVALVVDHLVRAERSHEVKLAVVVDPGYVRTELLGQLDGE
jgi:hypothetical protein